MTNSRAADVFCEEIADVSCDQVAVLFQREVTGVEQVELQVLQITFVRFRARRRKNEIVFSPHDQRRRLVLTEVSLPLRVKWRGRAVVVEELQLNIVVAGAIELILVGSPRVGADVLDVSYAVRVLPLRRFIREKLSQRLGVLSRPVFPVRLERSPEVAQPLFVGVAVLHDQGLHSLRVFYREAIADRRAVVLNVEAVAFELQSLREYVDYVGQVVDGVIELVNRRA